MKKIALVSAHLALIAALSISPATAETVILTMSTHIPQPSAVTESHTVQCDAAIYTLASSKQARTLTVSRNDKLIADLSATDFGQRVTASALLGRYAFDCPKDALGLTFDGIEVFPDGPPKGIKYLATINDDGRVRSDKGVQHNEVNAIGKPQVMKLRPLPAK
ncbi:hypothetical protein [Massilia sp. CCM 8734]|uniref:hypothetical protein n=1 Tax=Massilia sp. CCM 8734 TaxID=2609283 RepID=UPI00142335C1|nr:hypothetical protein [Massilia sp. CCM 8734]NHZ98422.1 hypothetical protein [Massilia sp. CCM 8734]